MNVSIGRHGLQIRANEGEDITNIEEMCEMGQVSACYALL
jgi:hypothetical protein